MFNQLSKFTTFSFSLDIKAFWALVGIKLDRRSLHMNLQHRKTVPYLRWKEEKRRIVQRSRQAEDKCVVYFLTFYLIFWRQVSWDTCFDSICIELLYERSIIEICRVVLWSSEHIVKVAILSQFNKGIWVQSC